MNPKNGDLGKNKGKFSFISIIKKFWPILLVQSAVSISISGLMLNMLGISNVIWPSEPFHELEMGVLVSSKMLTTAILGLVIGIFADRISRRKLFIFILILMGIARFINGFIPLYAPYTFLLFVLSYALLGVGQGGVNPLIISYSNDASELKMRSRFFGVKETFNQIFLIAGMITSAWLIQSGLWRIYYWSTGILLLATAIIAAFILKDPKRGIMHEELKPVLSTEGIAYKYRLNKKTIKSTIFSHTNFIAFIEGIFTWIIFAIAVYLIYPYVQSPPYNVSPVVSSLLMIIFGVPGAIFGSITFAKISDKLAEKNIKYRVYMIVFSMVVLFIIIMLLFIIPLPHLTPTEASNIGNLLSYPIFILFGILLFILRAVLGIYHINQTPILQIINLPEAQGTISSWNQFLEELGFGLGPIISGFLLAITQNYQQTALTALFIGLPSIFLWLLANKWIKKDVQQIKSILKRRATEISNNRENKE